MNMTDKEISEFILKLAKAADKHALILSSKQLQTKLQNSVDRLEEELTDLTSQHKDLQSRYGKIQRYNAYLEDMLRNTAPQIPNEMLDINTYKYC